MFFLALQLLLDVCTFTVDSCVLTNLIKCEPTSVGSLSVRLQRYPDSVTKSKGLCRWRGWFYSSVLESRVSFPQVQISDFVLRGGILYVQYTWAAQHMHGSLTCLAASHTFHPVTAKVPHCRAFVAFETCKDRYWNKANAMQKPLFPHQITCFVSPLMRRWNIKQAFKYSVL